LFLYPGMLLILISGILSIFLFFGPVDIGFRYIDFHTFIGVGAIFYLGLNSLSFATITRVFAFQAGLLPYTPRFYSLFKYLNLEKGLLAGVLLILLGVVLLTQALALSYNFAQIGFDNSVRLVFGGSLALTSGAQIVFTSFVLSILGLKVWNTKTPQG